jgi:two-component system NarL family response regulator
VSNKIRVLVADDHVVARVGVVAIVNAQRDMTVVASVATGSDAVAMYRQHIPDVALLDMRMPSLSGVEAAVAIRSEFPAARMIALTTYGGDEDIRRALAAGVKSYLTKDIPQEELLNVIRVVHSGQDYVMASLAPLINSQHRPDLTPRELQVLELIVRGYVNKQIAYTLNLSLYTVANHVKTILKKLEVQDRTQAATEAIRRGIIHLS